MMTEIHDLRKYAPSTGPMDSFRPTQHSQLVSAMSSGVSPVPLDNLAGLHSHRLITEAICTLEAIGTNLMSSIVSALCGKDLLNLSQFDRVFNNAHTSNDPQAPSMGR